MGIARATQSRTESTLASIMLRLAFAMLLAAQYCSSATHLTSRRSVSGCVWGATDPSDSKPMADVFDCDPVPAQDCHSASCVTDPITTGLNTRLGSTSPRFDAKFTFGRSIWTNYGLAYLQTGSGYNAEEGCLAALGPLNQVLQLTAQEMATCSQDRAGCSDSPDANECPGFACCGNRLAHSPSGDRDKHMAMTAHWATTEAPTTEAPTTHTVVLRPTAAPSAAASSSAVVKTCSVMGPSYYTGGGASIAGQDWPINLGASAVAHDCADRCAALPACNGYHFYGSHDSQLDARGTCYLWQAMTALDGPRQDGRDRYAGTCTVGNTTPAAKDGYGLPEYNTRCLFQLIGIVLLLIGLVWGFFERKRRRNLSTKPERTGGYLSSLCECCCKPSLWIPACCFTPVLAAFNRAEADDRECTSCDVCFSLCKPVAQYTTRQTIRGKYNLADNASDGCIACFCTPCAVAQDSLELEKRASVQARPMSASMSAPGLPVYVTAASAPPFTTTCEVVVHKIDTADKQV